MVCGKGGPTVKSKNGELHFKQGLSVKALSTQVIVNFTMTGELTEVPDGKSPLRVQEITMAIGDRAPYLLRLIQVKCKEGAVPFSVATLDTKQQPLEMQELLSGH